MSNGATYDIGDGVSLSFTVTLGGVLTNATVTLTVTDPAGTVTTPAVANPSVGVYTSAVAPGTAGTWLYRWTATGAATSAEDGVFIVEALASQDVYASVPELRDRFRIEDTEDDQLLEKAIRAASRHIDDMTNRRFYADQVATARVYCPWSAIRVDTDDFWTTTGLVVKTDDGTGTYPTTLAAGTYITEPLNGLVSGQPRPYNRIRSLSSILVGGYWNTPPSVQVTAKWGWASVPAPVRDACLIEAAELFRTKDAQFGIRTGDFGAIRIRPNPKVAELVVPYARDSVMVA